MGSISYGKILTVFVLIGSASFMGFAAVNHLAGPNWTRKSQELAEYEFKQAAPGASWTVTTRDLQSESVATTKSLAAAYIAALRHKEQRLKSEKTAIDQQLTNLTSRKTEAQALIDADVPAIQKRVAFLTEEINRQNTENKRVAEEILAKTDEAQQLNLQISTRREETERMRTQLEELRSRKASMEEKKRRLSDLLTQAQGNLERAQRRLELLQSDVAQPAVN